MCCGVSVRLTRGRASECGADVGGVVVAAAIGRSGLGAAMGACASDVLGDVAV